MAGAGYLHLDENVVDLARARIARAYDVCDWLIVYFSGGKDSTAVLNLTVEVARELGKLPVEVAFFDEEAIPMVTQEYVTRVVERFGDEIKLRWYCLPVKHRNACSNREPWWYPWAPEKRHLWTRELPPLAITEDMVPGFQRLPIPKQGSMVMPRSRGIAGAVQGIRAQESMARRRGVMKRGTDNFISGLPDEPWIKQVKPIYDWRTEDIWTAPKVFGWDYNRAYDLMRAAGFSFHQQRISPPFGEEPLRQLWLYAQCFPAEWEKMTQRVDGVATAGRYANSPLYGVGGLPAGFDHTLPPEPQIKRALQRWAPTERKQIATAIQKYVRLHYRKTDKPLPMVDPSESPTGFTWLKLYKIAVIGDLKGRRALSILYKGDGDRDDEMLDRKTIV